MRLSSSMIATQVRYNMYICRDSCGEFLCGNIESRAGSIILLCPSFGKGSSSPHIAVCRFVMMIGNEDGVIYIYVSAG